VSGCCWSAGRRRTGDGGTSPNTLRIDKMSARCWQRTHCRLPRRPSAPPAVVHHCRSPAPHFVTPRDDLRVARARPCPVLPIEVPKEFVPPPMLTRSPLTLCWHRLGAICRWARQQPRRPGKVLDRRRRQSRRRGEESPLWHWQSARQPARLGGHSHRCWNLGKVSGVEESR
jgi:hypothetical protein